ncbi:hypothetical protein JYU15_01525 [bacterium AH-315-I18]|nr:hypothetical protein [Phycisphaeraceae bacterium]MBN4061093.1 hypothetical protein [bacterium AH-315-I18]
MFLCRLTAVTFAITLIAIVLSPTVSVFAQPQVTDNQVQLVETFDLLPSQYQMILAVPDLRTLSDRAAQINDKLKLQITGLTDLLNEFKRAMGMDRGVDSKGSMFLVVENLESLLPPDPSDKEERPAPAPRFVALIPVSDYAEFAANFGGSADDLVATLTLPSSQRAYSKIHNGYAIISSSKKRVEDYTPGLTRRALAQLVSDSGTQVLVRSDISLILKPQGMPDYAYEHLVNIVKTSLSPEDQEEVPVNTDTDQKTNGQVIADVCHNALLRAVKDSDHIVIGFSSTDQGMNINMAMTFKPSSSMTRIFTGAADPTTVLDRLPNRDYLYSFATRLDQIQSRKLIDNLTAELNASSVWYGPLFNDASPLLEQIQEVGHVFYAPQGPIGLSTRVMNIVVILKVPDAQSFVSSFEQFLTQANGKSYPMGPMLKDETAETDSRPHVSVTSLFAANALSDDRAKIAQYQLQYNMPIRVQAKMNNLSRRMMMLGLNNQEGYITAVDQNTVVLTTATDAQIIKDTLTLLNKTDAGGLSQIPSLIKANALGLKNASGQFHGNVVNTLQGAYKLIELLMGKQDLDPVFPADLMPMSISYKTLKNTITARIHLPLDTITYLRDDAMTILEPLFPKPVINPNGFENTPSQKRRQEQRPGADMGMPDEGMFDPTMMGN